MFLSDDLERLARAADPECRRCHGEGFITWAGLVQVSCQCTDEVLCASLTDCHH